ncbi:hypothetical protein K502DRAFT_323169 [Neoconidiobolus thromboides FSU 785]|nr:hypothetical protein K502DRAFT_323169 [Neoconidiobolus thromboides FSU 785]
MDNYLINQNIVNIDGSILSNTRKELYMKGGVVAITSRILVVDMLCDRVPIHLITGFLLLEAHKIKPHSSEAFLLRIFREKNKDGFIKAFSDRPELFLRGFSPLERTLKTLFLRKAQLWPRFQFEVKKELEIETNIEVIELRQPLTKKMTIIQNSIMDCLQTCLLELKRSKLLKEIDDDLTIDFALNSNFISYVRHYLEPQWHRIGFNTKELISDIYTLKNLLRYLLNYDCVSFLRYLDIILSMNQSNSANSNSNGPSPWLLTDAANILIMTAKSRVFSSKDNTIPILELQPKWKVVEQLIEEIKEEIENNKSNELRANILISTDSIRSSQQMKEYLSKLKEKNEKNNCHLMLYEKYEDYVLWKNSINQITCDNNGNNQNRNQNNKVNNKRRRVRGEKKNPNQSNQINITSFSLFDSLNLSKKNENKNEVKINKSEEKDDINKDGENKTNDDKYIENFEIDFDEMMSSFYSNIYEKSYELLNSNDDNKYDIIVNSFDNGDLSDLFLQDYKPNYIIIVNPEPSFIRRIEVYQAQNKHIQIKVYFLIYSDSVEEQKYLATIRREKEGFETLIRERANLAIPIDYGLNINNGNSNLFLSSINNTRIAGGQKLILNNNKIIVDVREFRSSLPSNLHFNGFELLPATLQIGDYILSPNICVERKSIPDLIGSFKSGRLHKQVEMIFKYYTVAVLLIEFDENKIFSFEELGEHKSEFSLADIRSKLALLTILFPKLKIIWSSSPNQTCELFFLLKSEEKQPDLEKCIKIGTDEQDQINQLTNDGPLALLRSLPGVNFYNINNIMKKVNSIKDLCSLNLTQIQELIGTQNGELLYAFIQKK